METPIPVFPGWPLLLPRAQGLLAGLIYLDSTATTIAHFPNPHSLNPQISYQWERLRIVRAKLDQSRQRIIIATHNLYLVGLDDALNCFVKPTRFYEAAISGYRNTLLHMPPTTLGEVLALCSLSHAILHCADRISFEFSHLETWRNAIANHKHRQLFGDLIRAAFLELRLTSQASCSFSTLMDDSRSMHQSYLEESSTISTLQGHDPANDSLGSFWGYHNAMDGSVTINSPFTSQTGHSSHMINDSTNFTSTPSPDLQGSPITHTLTHFLEDCGELTFVLSSPSSRGATTQPELGSRIEPSYIQRLRNDSSFKDPRVQAIVSVIDSFINLGYLQSVNEVRHYMLLLGNEILPSGLFFPSFCQSVCAGVDKAESRTDLPHSRRLRRSNPKRIPCDICDEVFTRNTNMKRHIKRKHPGSQIRSMPTRPALHLEIER